MQKTFRSYRQVPGLKYCCKCSLSKVLLNTAEKSQKTQENKRPSMEDKNWKTTGRLPDDWQKWHPTTDSPQKRPRVLGGPFQRTPLRSSYSCFSFLSNLTLKYDISFSSYRSFFLIELLKTVTLSCIFSEFVEMFFHNLGSLIEILYLDLLI